MKVRIFDDKVTLGKAAAAAGAEKIRAALRNRGRANIILATGASQFEMLAALLEEPGIDWSRIRIFHLDEYIGLPADHRPGSATTSGSGSCRSCRFRRRRSIR